MRTSCSLPLRSTNSILHEWPLMLEIVHRCGSQISLRGALPLSVRIGLRLHIPRLDEWTHVWTVLRQWECTWQNFSWFSWILWVPAGVSHQPSSSCRVSSTYLLLRPGKPTLIPPPGLDISLPWESAVSLESMTNDSSPLLLLCWPNAPLPSYLRWKFEVSSGFHVWPSSACPPFLNWQA